MGEPTLFDDDPTVPSVELTDTDIGIIASATWPDMRGYNPDDPHAERVSQQVVQGRFVDWIRSQAPQAAVFFGSAHVAIRQDGMPDLVVYAGETLHTIAGQVTR